MATARTKHVVLFPFPGHGHLANFLALAGLLCCELPDATMTLVSTPRNVAALRSSAAAEQSSWLGFHALPFVPANHGLPPDCESTSSLPFHEYIKLFEAFDTLEPAFDGYVQGLTGNSNAAAAVCVVADPFVAWTVDVARRRGCAHAFLASCGALGTADLHAVWKNMPVLPFGTGGELLLPELPELALHRSQLSPSFLRGLERLTTYQHRHLPRGYLTDAVISNTVEKLEPTGLAMLRRVLLGKVPVWPIGPLVRTVSDQPETDTADGVVRWLDRQPPSSVLYISFGSQNTIWASQMMELATALETTGRQFVWAIRPPMGFNINGAFRDDWLPEGFESRARAENRGVLARGWAPQLRVLAHRATAAFLSHCGWNSVLENLTHGVPLVGWPVAAEQFYNVMMLEEEWGVCVEVARGNLESSTVDRARVAEVLEKVMGDTPESAAMRPWVAEARRVLSEAWAEDGGSSRVAMHEFLRAMQLK